MGYILDSIKALFTKNTTNAASVSGARVPIMSADGTPIGNDSLANLASVLGGFIQSTGMDSLTGGDVDTIRKGIFQIPSVVASNVSNLPVVKPGILWVPFYRSGYWSVQFYITYDSVSEIYFRIGNSSSYNNWQLLARA